MSTSHRTCQHTDTVVCVRNEVCKGNVEFRGIPTVMENARFWEADLIAMDFSIGIKRWGPCDLKQQSMSHITAGLFI